MAEFFAMGGYAAYIWPAYAVAAVVLVAMLVVALRTVREREATLRALEDSRGPRRRTRATAGRTGGDTAGREAAAGMGEQ